MRQDKLRFGKYEVVRLVGEGSMAAVYEAVHTGLAKRVAVKVLLPSVAANPDARELFLREGRAAARVRHPHVVDVTDLAEEDGRPYLVMEFLEGETLAEYLRRKGALSLDRACDLLLPILAGVAAGHEEGVVHRDLKPQNVILSRDRRGHRVPKVVDFGLSRLMDHSTAGEGIGPVGARVGTALYLAPEQALGQKADGRTDQYQLGLVLYEMVTGHPAFAAQNLFALVQTVQSNSFVLPRKLRLDLPADFEAVLLKALALAPASRHDSLYTFGNALLPFASAKASMRWAPTFPATS